MADDSVRPPSTINHQPSTIALRSLVVGLEECRSAPACATPTEVVADEVDAGDALVPGEHGLGERPPVRLRGSRLLVRVHGFLELILFFAHGCGLSGRPGRIP